MLLAWVVGIYIWCNLGYICKWKGNHCSCIINQPETMFKESRLCLMFQDFCWLKRATGNTVINSSPTFYFRWDLQNNRECLSSILILRPLLTRHFFPVIQVTLLTREPVSTIFLQSRAARQGCTLQLHLAGHWFF